MVEISRSTPRDFGVSDRVEGAVKRERNPVGGARGGVWSMVEELQLLPWLVEFTSAVAPEKVGANWFDLSHAARVAESTGQASAGDSVSLPMFIVKCEDKIDFR